jgi:hypothetical protein
MSANENRFDFDLPSGWEDQTVYTFKGPDDGEMEHTIMLIVDRKLLQDSVAAYAQERTAPITDTLQGVDVLKDEETTVPGCNPSYDFFYKWVPSDGTILFQKSTFVIAGGMGFCFCGRFSKRTLKTVGSMMKKVVESVLPGTYEPLE